MSKEVEMKSVDEKKKEEKKDQKKDGKNEKKDDKSKDKKDSKDKKEKEKEAEKPKPLTPLQEIKLNITLIERSVVTLEPRFTHRVLRTFTTLKKKLTPEILRESINAVYVKDNLIKQTLLSYLPPPPPPPPKEEPAAMEVDTAVPAATEAKPETKAETKSETKADSKTEAKPTETTPAPPPTDPLPESEVYFRLLLIHWLLTSPESHPKALELVHDTITKIQTWNRRSMDSLAARVYFVLSRVYELLPTVELSEIRPLLLRSQRTASLRHDAESLAAVIVLLLRNYLHYNLYSQADKFVAKVTFPESAGNPQLARWLYYTGRIKAVQLSYTDAHETLQQAIRRAPAATTAPGFWQAVHKFFIVVELLMGEIPDRKTFRHPVLEKAMKSYFEIVNAVRTGSLSQFQASLNAHADQFTEDRTYSLILRLRQNVIKTGIRQLSLAYSRISLRDICVKLHLDSEEDAEYIVGKAIRDGVIEGRVVHEKGWMECGGGKDGYGVEVSEAFGKRISFCLELHNESVKAMRYPLNAHRKELDAAEGAREREKELAKEIADGKNLDGDDESMGDF
ncbi:hypothetical protein SISNIDRAFT_450981 [Sistotremastrum niveocremeum HHB9708]|uniref:PCI domain-containing protein n=1 Tax=Sistotremastrum niveocremeum HHB9708 TaxID=1314777 RepID=A0A164XUR2_9AGAM|nr:hypothetical protein SISNIDRAFT_450981 [Sistotremastrum niveocremeum HHB9708]